MDGKKADFRIRDSSSYVEIKTESYCLSGKHGRHTQNLFMERYSDVDKQSPGGPWQAVSKCKYFISFFPCCKTFYFFETKKLVRALDKLIETKQVKSIRIPNKTGDNKWTTLGYPVPIELLEAQVFIF